VVEESVDVGAQFDLTGVGSSIGPDQIFSCVLSFSSLFQIFPSPSQDSLLFLSGIGYIPRYSVLFFFQLFTC